MRDLVKIVVIDEVRPIEGADSICAYRVGGWWVVDKINAHHVGDKAVYCETDSFIPHEIAPFLTKPGQDPKTYNGVKGERLRTVKLRGQVSQGLLLPLSILGGRSTDELGIVKYEPPMPTQLHGEAIGLFPSEVRKTDQERVQNLTSTYQLLVDNSTLFEVTEKLDGTSCTFYLDWDAKFHVCSRNLDMRESDTNVYWKLARELDIEGKMTGLGMLGVAVQGEIVGPGIQGNRYKLDNPTFFLFDVYDVCNGSYLSPMKRQRVAADLDLYHVPVHHGAFLLRLHHSMEDCLEYSDMRSAINGQVWQEGFVYKALDGSISFKAISNKFLLKGGE